ncbi:sensor histidine kinase [Maridesulfovibrio ferrireducens]|uniref:sensor histidine kinase n=1 Tax=Maridesulfovibrio ferrireducens TaxID=246191 RepID=UPI001A28C6AC|nr:sensor histidine kinase [Maridesulfovibrio ferrireducens]MBI9110921.1 HAMP domain-containing histidine kinase [Maridesulfovibrio ferrireducens]
MGSSGNIQGRDGLCFFGKVSATISHDVKNVLAIINEEAGLLHDLSLMAAQGMELEPERLVKLAEKIQNQIKRGDSIIKNMNRFAHSVDVPECEIDLSETVSLVIALFTRMAAAKCVTVTLKEGEKVTAKCDPFSTEMLIARCLEVSMDSAGKDSEITVEVLMKNSEKVISVHGLEQDVAEKEFQAIEVLSKNANASVKMKTQDKILEIIF